MSCFETRPDDFAVRVPRRLAGHLDAYRKRYRLWPTRRDLIIHLLQNALFDEDVQRRTAKRTNKG
jgi:hypothetical protein